MDMSQKIDFYILSCMWQVWYTCYLSKWHINMALPDGVLKAVEFIRLYVISDIDAPYIHSFVFETKNDMERVFKVTQQNGKRVALPLGVYAKIPLHEMPCMDVCETHVGIVIVCRELHNKWFVKVPKSDIVPSTIPVSQFKANVPTTTGCWQCGHTEHLSKCVQCKVAKYCSKECQRTHWKLHKNECTTHTNTIMSWPFIT